MSFVCLFCKKSFPSRLKRPPGCLNIGRCELAEDEDPDNDELRKLRAPQHSETESKPPLATIRARIVIGEESFELHDGDMLGREGDVAAHLFSRDKTVSRKHAKIHFPEKGICLKNCATNGNPIVVGGRKFGFDAQETLPAGTHRIILGTRFELTLEVS